MFEIGVLLTYANIDKLNIQGWGLTIALSIFVLFMALIVFVLNKKLINEMKNEIESEVKENEKD